MGGPETTNLDCIHCGLCLAVCPTYQQLGSEVDSPRGRIYLMGAVAENRIAPSSPVFEKHIHLCLECRACESACPSGVRFSVMMSGARAAIRKQSGFPLFTRIVRKLVFRLVFPSHPMMHAAFRLLRVYQKSGMQRLARVSGMLKLLPARGRMLESMLPEVPRAPRYRLPKRAPAAGRSRVALFRGCIMPELFGAVHEATVRVLQRNGVSVCMPARQTCCGALHIHDGELEQALELARRNIDAFENDGAEFLVVNAAGCGAMLKEYEKLLKDDLIYSERAQSFSHRVRDVSEFLVELGITGDLGPLTLKATYDDPCHLLHGQGIRNAPRELLRRIPGLELIELRDSDRCCGSAGIYNITHPDMASRILAGKIDNIMRTGAQVVATGNPGCLLQISAGLQARGSKIAAVHPVELLDQSYRAAAGNSEVGNDRPE